MSFVFVPFNALQRWVFKKNIGLLTLINFVQVLGDNSVERLSNGVSCEREKTDPTFCYFLQPFSRLHKWKDPAGPLRGRNVLTMGFDRPRPFLLKVMAQNRNKHLGYKVASLKLLTLLEDKKKEKGIGETYRMMNVVTRCRISSSFPDAPPFPYSLLFFSSVELPMEKLTLVRMLVLLSQPDSCSERL